MSAREENAGFARALEIVRRDGPDPARLEAMALRLERAVLDAPAAPTPRASSWLHLDARARIGLLVGAALVAYFASRPFWVGGPRTDRDPAGALASRATEAPSPPQLARSSGAPVAGPQTPLGDVPPESAAPSAPTLGVVPATTPIALENVGSVEPAAPELAVELSTAEPRPDELVSADRATPRVAGALVDEGGQRMVFESDALGGEDQSFEDEETATATSADERDAVRPSGAVAAPHRASGRRRDASVAPTGRTPRMRASASNRGESSRREVRTSGPTDSPRGARLSHEVELLTGAQRALRDSPARALELARQHEQRFRYGTFAEERDALIIEALFRLGRMSDARSRAERFMLAWPDSPQRGRFRRLLE